MQEPAPKQDGTDHLFPYDIPNKYPFDNNILQKKQVGQIQSFHCVNLAQGIKTPVVYYQRQQDPALLRSAKKALADIEQYHGQAQGMYGGDEGMHGNAPTQGIEFCSISELMFSLETMLQVSGDVDFADRLEKITYNALPTQATDDFMNRQYFQSANQVLITRGGRNFFEDVQHAGTDLCFGLLTGYPCCTSNMHQAWPKWVQNLWYNTADSGVAALLYAPCRVDIKVAGNQVVTIQEQTQYPFDENIVFTISSKQPARFPFHLRIPQWATGASVKINGRVWGGAIQAGKIVQLHETWKHGDIIELQLPMKVRTSRWAELSAAVERGPLVYALKIEEEWKVKDDKDRFGPYFEVYPKSAWNYGLLKDAVAKPEENFEVIKQDNKQLYPWNLQNAPVLIKTRAKKIPSWQLYSNMAGPLPNTMVATGTGKTEEIVLVPYGCSTLRITQFPVVD